MAKPFAQTAKSMWQTAPERKTCWSLVYHVEWSLCKSSTSRVAVGLPGGFYFGQAEFEKRN